MGDVNPLHALYELDNSMDPFWGGSASDGGGLSAAGIPGDGRTAPGAATAAQSSTLGPPPASPTATPAKATSDLTSSDLETLTSSSSPSVGRQTPRQAGSKPDKSWTAETSSAAMKELVAKRNYIFERQRAGRDLPLQASSFEKVSATLQQHYVSASSPYLSAFRNYASFCQRMDVPIFPITNTLVALWIFEKCSTGKGYFHTYKHGVSLAADLAFEDWKDQSIYHELCRFDPDAAALTEFMEERRLKYHAKPKSKTAAAQPSARATPLNGAGTKRASRPTSDMDTDETTSSNDEDDSDYEDGAAGLAAEEATDEPGTGNPRVSGLPTREDQFASETDVFKAYVAALVPAYGISVTMTKNSSTSVHIRCNRHHPHFVSWPGGTCDWMAVAKKINSAWRVDFNASIFKHSHGPCKEILADPSWRPKVRNPHARQALGLPPKADRLYPASLVPKQQQQQQQQQPKPIGQLKQSGQPLQKKQRIDVGPSDRPLAQALPAAAAVKSAPSTPAAVPSTKTPVPPAPTPHTSAPPAQPVAIPSSRPPPPNSSIAFPPALPQDPLTLVRTFCAGLHPSLVSLAPALLSAGVNSLDDFVSLRCFHPDIRTHFLDIMRQEWTRKCETDSSLSPISLSQLHLLSKHLSA